MPPDTPAPTGNEPGKTGPAAGQRPASGPDAGQGGARVRASGSGSRGRTLILWTFLALIAGAVIIAAAVVLTKPARTDLASFSPIAPSAVTPADIAASGRTLGDPAARVTIDIYEDFRCTGCAAFRTEIEPLVEAQYIRSGKARIAFHDYLTIDRPGTTESRDAANAALCAADQGRFWTMHDWLFANQSPAELPGYFTPDRLVVIGRAAGMDMSTFEPCVRNGSHNRDVETEQAFERNRISFTPSIFVNGRLVENPDNPQAIPTPQHLGAAIARVLSR